MPTPLSCGHVSGIGIHACILHLPHDLLENASRGAGFDLLVCDWGLAHQKALSGSKHQGEIHFGNDAVDSESSVIVCPHRLALPSEHWPQAPDGWQAGVAPPHSLSPVQARQV